VNFGFSKADRLLKRSDFVLLSRSGKKLHSANFLALFRRSAAGRSRLGITVTRKVADAPGRNRLKRLVRESFRHARSEFKCCWDIVIIAKQRPEVIPSAEALAELTALFEKISRLDDDQPHTRSAIACRH
jgi:ribonuclease P protein component